MIDYKDLPNIVTEAVKPYEVAYFERKKEFNEYIDSYTINIKSEYYDNNFDVEIYKHNNIHVVNFIDLHWIMPEEFLTIEETMYYLKLILDKEFANK